MGSFGTAKKTYSRAGSSITKTTTKPFTSTHGSRTGMHLRHDYVYNQIASVSKSGPLYSKTRSYNTNKRPWHQTAHGSDVFYEKNISNTHYNVNAKKAALVGVGAAGAAYGAHKGYQKYKTSPMHAEHVKKFHQMKLALQGQHGVRSHGV